jgi:hypothetical protein
MEKKIHERAAIAGSPNSSICHWVELVFIEISFLKIFVDMYLKNWKFPFLEI